MESFAPTAFLQVGVLILIIMEDTHGAVSIRKRMGKKVLILIIMEDTHGDH